jgi:hypothetical protein
LAGLALDTPPPGRRRASVPCQATGSGHGTLMLPVCVSLYVYMYVKWVVRAGRVSVRQLIVRVGFERLERATSQRDWFSFATTGRSGSNATGRCAVVELARVPTLSQMSAAARRTESERRATRPPTGACGPRERRSRDLLSLVAVAAEALLNERRSSIGAGGVVAGKGAKRT